MVCIYCEHKTTVSNSRTSKKAHTTWRRRECTYCHSVFTSREYIDYSSALRVRTKSGSLAPFRRDKLLISIYQSLSHRKTALDDASALTETAITQLLHTSHRGLMDAASITEFTIKILDHFDSAAATHYRAHHPIQ